MVFKNGKAFTYNAVNVRIVESALNAEKPRNRFEYLKRIAKAVGLTVEVEPGRVINILASNYANIDFVSPDDMLGAFLSGALPETRIVGAFEPVYPFGFNASQKNAVDRALSSPLSVRGSAGDGQDTDASSCVTKRTNTIFSRGKKASKN